jgi:hypothetical protein
MSMTVNNTPRPTGAYPVSHPARPAGEKGPKNNSCSSPSSDSLQLSGSRPSNNFSEMLQNGPVTGKGEFAKQAGTKDGPSTGPRGFILSRPAAE